jgi:hypothetical protein
VQTCCPEQAAVNHRENIAAEHEAVAFGLRDRALARLDTMIADPKLKSVYVSVQVGRLKTVRAVVNRDPFHRLDADYMEVVYYKLSKTSKEAFWLARYDENVVAWYWAFPGVMDIRATLAGEPFKTFSRQELAFVCNMMWMDTIGARVYVNGVAGHNESCVVQCMRINVSMTA